ncbi:MAG: Cro/Cl family transcriptional regulator [Aliivibrio sp.]|uniref:Cro/CI family transcriptional regulator n=1 Tax=Aliivibrio sp. TaxID=1872443 RepID=UPI001A3DDF06|nr:Cro/Cl family transcriptional regulator [Aliivibrio sp.]
MRKEEAVKYFGSVTELSKKLNVTTQSISQWGEKIPLRRAFEIERITNGALKADFTPIQSNI